MKDYAGAKQCLEQVLATGQGVGNLVSHSPGHLGSLHQGEKTFPTAYFASVNTGIRGYLTRHNLAAVCHELRDYEAAERHWRAVLAERRDYEPAWLGLAEIYLAQKRWPEVEQLAGELEAKGNLQGTMLRARSFLQQGEFNAARAVLFEAIDRYPDAIEPRRLLSHAYLQEGLDWQAAEEALHAVLRLDPQHTEARHNLGVLAAKKAS